MAIFTLLIASLPFTGAVTVFGLSPLISGALIQLGKAALWSAVGKALAPGVPRQQVQAVINQAAAARIRGYGRMKLGGVRALFEAQDGVLHQIVVAHQGALSALTGFEVDGRRVTLDGAGNVTSGPSAGYVKILSNIGAVNGGNYGEAQAAFPVIWTLDHDLKGCATYYVQMTRPKDSRFAQVFPKQSNTLVQMIVQGVEVFDPRTSVTGYSANAALVVRDFLRSAEGFGIAAADLGGASFETFADTCDENVTLRLGGTEKRYRCEGYYTLEDAPRDVLARMLATCDGQVYMTAEGKIGILGGSWSVPDVTIGDDDILELSLTDGFDPFSDFNVLKGTYTDPDNGFQDTECAELRDEVALLTQAVRAESLDVDMCPSASQMQRLLKIARAKRQRRWTGTLRTNLVGLKARFPKGDGVHTIRVVHAAFGLDDVFEVTSHAYSAAERVCVIGIASLSNAYGWTAATEEKDRPGRLVDLPVPETDNSSPLGLTLTQNVVGIGQGINGVTVSAEVTAPVQPLTLLLELRNVTVSGSWVRMAVPDGDFRGVSGLLADGQVYQVRAGWADRGDWVYSSNFTAVSNPVAPDPPTNFSHTLIAGVVTLTWENGDAGFYRTRLYRGATTNFNDAVLIATIAGSAGQASSKTNSPGTGTWRYWVVTVNRSLVASAAVGPRTATI